MLPGGRRSGGIQRRRRRVRRTTRCTGSRKLYEVLAVDAAAREEHIRNLPERGEVVDGVAVHDQEIRLLAGFECAYERVHAARARGASRVADTIASMLDMPAIACASMSVW